MSGYLLFLFGIVVWLRGRQSVHPATRLAFNLMMAVLAGQVVLGILTALNAAPLHLAISHQAGAVALWVIILTARHRAEYPVIQSIRGQK